MFCNSKSMQNYNIFRYYLNYVNIFLKYFLSRNQNADYLTFIKVQN